MLTTLSSADKRIVFPVPVAFLTARPFRENAILMVIRHTVVVVALALAVTMSP